MSFKAVLAGLVFDSNNNRLDNVSIFYTDGSSAVNSNIDISLSGVQSEKDFTDAVTLAIISDALNSHSLTITEADILWTGVSSISLVNARALNGDLKSGVIDGRLLGTSSIFTVPAGKLWLPTGFIYRVTNKQGTVLVPPELTFGTNAPNYNDIVSSNPATGLVTQGSMSAMLVDNSAIVVPANTQVKVRVATAAVGGTAYDFRVIAVGTFIDP